MLYKIASEGYDLGHLSESKQGICFRVNRDSFGLFNNTQVGRTLLKERFIAGGGGGRVRFSFFQLHVGCLQKLLLP